MVSTAWRTTTTTLSSSRLEVAVCIALAVALLTPPIPAVAATAAAYASPRIVPKRTAATKISTPFNHHHHHRHHPIFRPVALSLFSAQNNNYDSPHQRTGRHSPTPRTRTTATTILRATPPKEEEDIALLDDNNNNEGTIVRLPLEQQQQPRVYAQRWIQLAYLSLLALFSDWICFSVAAAPETYETVYAHHSAASIIDLFLFTNVASCFLVTNIVKKIGLQSAIRGAAVLMTVGCWMRSGVAFLPFVDIDTATLVSYPCLVGGTLLVGAAQPFFQCTPPLLSATWFAPSERATATAIALNFNQIGIATAFLVGGAMATTPVGLGQYFGVIAVLCTIVAGGTLLQFQNEPAIPPSASEMEKKKRQQEPDHTEPSFVESAQRLFQTNGFTPALVAFVCSIAITNIVGTFIEEILHRGGVDNQGAIDLAGAGFELAILVGGIVIGGYVDHTKHYKQVTLACLTVTAMAVIPLGWTFASGQATAAAMPHAWAPLVVVGALMVLGLAAGPVQPINAELAVDVTYPSDETAVESVQQVGGNMISALLIPVAEAASQTDLPVFTNIPSLASNVRGDVILLLLLTLLTMGYFNTFDAPLARTLADSDDGVISGTENELKTTEEFAVERSSTTTTTSASLVNLVVE